MTVSIVPSTIITLLLYFDLLVPYLLLKDSTSSSSSLPPGAHIGTTVQQDSAAHNESLYWKSYCFWKYRSWSSIHCFGFPTYVKEFALKKPHQKQHHKNPRPNLPLHLSYNKHVFLANQYTSGEKSWHCNFCSISPISSRDKIISWMTINFFSSLWN